MRYNWGMDYTEKLSRLRLIRSPNVGQITARLLLRRYGSAREALLHLPDLSARVGRKIRLFPKAEAEAELEKLAAFGGEMIIFGHADYPAALNRFDDAPFCFSIKGHKTLLSRPMMAIVGARNASINAHKLAERLARECGEAGYVIVSGLARGIDTAAHKGSLTTGTIAVIAGGIDVVYPSENQRLYEQITEIGMVLGEMPFGTQPSARLFPVRNRIIASLVRGCLVVEAAEKSGSLITANNAAERGAEVMALPGSPLDPRARGCNRLIQDGASLVQSADDILHLLDRLPDVEEAGSGDDKDSFGSGFGLRTAEPPSEKEVEMARQAIVENLAHDPIDVDELMRWCHLSADVMAAALLELELAGRILRHHGHRVSAQLDWDDQPD